MWVESKDPFVFPKHCNQVFFYSDVLNEDWWSVLRHRSKHIFYKNNVTMPSDEDNQGDGNEDWLVNYLFLNVYCGCVILLWVSMMDDYVFFSSFYNYVGYEKLTTIYNYHTENKLNRRTSIRFGFDIFSLSYLLFIIANLCCIVLKYVYLNLWITKH